MQEIPKNNSNRYSNLHRIKIWCENLTSPQHTYKRIKSDSPEILKLILKEKRKN